MKLLYWPHDSLRTKTRVLPPPDAKFGRPELEAIIEQMFAVMRQHRGIGLAAPQVGLPYRLFVTSAGGEDKTFINPEVVIWGDTPLKLVDEGCLSFPDLFYKATRAPHCVVTYQTLDDWAKSSESRFCDTSLSVEGLLSQCVQHETEHLDGITMADHVGVAKRSLWRRKLQNAARTRFRAS